MGNITLSFTVQGDVYKRQEFVELLSQKRVFYQIPIVEDIHKDHIR